MASSSSSSSTYYYDKAKEAMAMATSVAASVMLARSLANELLPPEARELLSYGLAGVRSRLTWRHTFSIDQSDGYFSNTLFYDVKTYLASRMEADGNIKALQNLRLSTGVSMDEEDPDRLVVGMEEREEMPEVYQGAEFRWCLYTHPDSQADSLIGSLSRRGGKQYYHLTFHKSHKEKALKEYLPFIQATAKAIRDKERSLTIYMNEGSEWNDLDLNHPFTFTTLAMDHARKQFVIDDLDKFIKRKDYYRRIGKAWKRGYLLHGPPGTGKSSLVAAMANHLRFDIYELELTGVESNTQLRKLLLSMSSKAILLIEDIDCTIELMQRDDKKKNKDKPPNPKSSSDSSSKDEKVTLSGLLNFVDGLWSTTGEERIIVFTTNYKERLDPALLRPGRMDVHVYMGHCTPEPVRILVNNYHSIDDPDTYSSGGADRKEIEALMAEIEELIVEVKVTPAEVAETLIRSEIPRVALLELIEFLKSKNADDPNKEGEDANDDAKKQIKELIGEVNVTPAEVAETLISSEIPRVALLDLIELLKSKKECANNKEDEDADDPKEEEDADDAKTDDTSDSSDDA